MTKAVADATVLIYLAKLDRLDSLWSHHQPILVPEPVQTEVIQGGKDHGHADALLVEDALNEGHLTPTEPTTPHPEPIRELDLQPGDQAVLATALQREADTVLTDDGPLRSIARTINIPPRGTLAYLIHDLQSGTITFPEYLGLLERLTNTGFRIDTDLYAHAVRRGQELAQDPPD